MFGEAGDGDVDAVVALVESAYRGDASRQGWTTEADLLEGQRVDAAMVRAVLDAPEALVLTARTGADLVACCELRAPAPGDGAAYLGMFAVRPEEQAGGVGRLVLEAAHREAARRWDARRMVLQVIEDRVELIAWYRRRGYEATGETVAFPYGDERFGRPTRPGLRFVVLARALDDVDTDLGHR